jgi:hypothetical protein
VHHSTLRLPLLVARVAEALAPAPGAGQEDKENAGEAEPLPRRAIPSPAIKKWIHEVE